VNLKTKLVVAITVMVAALVGAFSYVYLSQLVRSRIAEAYNDAQFVVHEIQNSAREVVDNTDLRDTRVDTDNPEEVKAALREALQSDPGLNTLLESIVGYSPMVYDVMITDEQGSAVMHSLPSLVGQKFSARPEFGDLRTVSFRHQLSLIYGRRHADFYETRLPLSLKLGQEVPFGQVRVGISIIFLRNELKPQFDRAILFSVIAIITSMLLAAGLSHLALRPLTAISRRLDQLNAGNLEVATDGKAKRPRTDEFGVVSTKIDRLGRQMRDVKEVFSALKENLDQLMANLQEGLVLFTRDARIVLVSASAEQVVGRPRGEMLGGTVDQVFDRRTALGRIVLRGFQMHQGIAQQEVELEQGGRVQVSLDFIEQGGEEIGALLTMRDTESVRRIENEIELSRRLAAIGRLTSGVAHEVKNPINAIVVHMEILREKLSGADPDAQRHIEVIGSEIRRLDRVVQTLVDFTRPVELKMMDTDLRRVVDEVAMLASPEAEQRNVNIARDIPIEQLPAKIDSDLVKQALLNVVLNGVQAMPDGGTLTISARRYEESADIAVSDEGGGIPPEIRDKIFNLYFTTKQKGSGIGLAMTYRVMQLHNGSIEFDTMEGRGTTFHLRFPLTDAREQVVREVTARS
jgi:signal transduction histidine kinase